MLHLGFERHEARSRELVRSGSEEAGRRWSGPIGRSFTSLGYSILERLDTTTKLSARAGAAQGLPTTIVLGKGPVYTVMANGTPMGPP